MFWGQHLATVEQTISHGEVLSIKHALPRFSSARSAAADPTRHGSRAREVSARPVSSCPKSEAPRRRLDATVE